MSFPLEDGPFFGLLVSVLGEETEVCDVEAVVDDEDVVALDEVVALFFFVRFDGGSRCDDGLGRFKVFLLSRETSHRSSSIVDSIMLGMSGVVMYSGSNRCVALVMMDSANCSF